VTAVSGDEQAPQGYTRQAAMTAPEKTTEPADWVLALATPGPEQAVAMRQLHQLMLRAAGHQVWRMRAVLPDPSPATIEVIVNLPAATHDGPEHHAEGNDLAGAVADAMRTVLTPYQRRIAIALLVDAVPIDVLAQRLGTSRGALYKTVHDARVRLRGELTAKGYLPSTATRSPDPKPSSTPAGTR